MMAQLDKKVTQEKTAKDLLFTDEVYTCVASAIVKSVLNDMSDKNIGCVVVVENKKPVGIFTERDLLRKVIAKGLLVEQITMAEVMTPNPVCIKPHTPLKDILGAMRLGKFRHLVLISESGDVQGVFSIKDILSWITDYLNS